MRIYLQYLVTILLIIFALSVSPLSAKQQFVVVIDPGHGGGDIGTPHRRYKQDEKTVALNVALRLGRLIEWNYSDVKVVYTRKTDKYPSLPDRVQKAKDVKGDLFISIHVNACPDASAKGFETYVFGTDGSDSGKKRVEERLVEERENLDISGKRVNFDTDIDIETKILCQAQREKHNKQSLEVAKAVQSAMISTLKKSSYASNVKNRGVKAKNLFVLCFSPMPAILVELGYMSNVSEEKFIASDEGQECFANAIYKGFIEYKNKWDKRQLSNEKKSDVKQSQPISQQVPEVSKPEEKVINEESAVPKVDSKPFEAPKNIISEENKSADTSTKKITEQQTNPDRSEVVQVVWKIQFLTSRKLLKEGSPEFKGLKPVGYYKDGNIYKYTFGNAKQTADLSSEMAKVKQLFSEAFFVKFDSKGNRIK